MATSPFRCCRGVRVLTLAGLVGLLGLTGCSGGSGDDGDGAPPAGSAAEAAAVASEAASSPVAGAVTEEDDPVATDGPRPDTTDVVLSYLVYDGAAGAVVAGGYVSPVIEDGGTCTLELSRDGDSATATSDAVADASTTSCGELQVPADGLEPGEWTAVLAYDSPTTTGTSEPLVVQVGP